MKMIFSTQLLILAGLLCVPFAAQATTRIVTLEERSLVYQLLDRGFLSEGAMEIPLALLGEQGVPEGVVLSVSQELAHAKRTYQQGEPVEGLLVMLKNASGDAVEYSYNRTCPVQYRVYDFGWNLVFDSVHKDMCSVGTGPAVHPIQELAAGDVTVYEMRHSGVLMPGSYMVAMSFNGMFAGIKEITIQ
jgi:hypothetical protein